MLRLHQSQGNRTGFSLVELLTLLVITAVLATLLMGAASRWRRTAQRAECANNLKQLTIGDLAYFTDHEEFPVMDSIVPGTIKVEHLAILAHYLRCEIPEGKPSSWPVRAKQPRWYNCPAARETGYAEGITLGGGVYTGYAYLGGIEDSPMIRRRMAKLNEPERTVAKKGLRRGVLWCDILGEFRTTEPRRYESFHAVGRRVYEDFRVSESEIEGMNRAWSDGSVEWVPIADILHRRSQGTRPPLEHLLGNFYF